MAEIWRTKISVLDRERRNVSVTLEKVDNTDLENIKVLESYSVLDALIDTSERKQQVFDELKRQYQKKKQDDLDDAETIGTLGDDIIVAVENWESK